MPITREWEFYITNSPDSVPSTAIGVYEIANEEQETIYIGQGEIRNRLRDHANSNHGSDYIPVREAWFFRYEVTPYPVSREGELLEEHKRANGRLPKYNNLRNGSANREQGINETLYPTIL